LQLTTDSTFSLARPRAWPLGLSRLLRIAGRTRAATWVKALTIAAVATGFLASCGGPPAEPHGALTYSDDAKKAYDKAMEAFEAHEWEEAKTLFKEVKRKYSYSRYARLAELRMADADYGSEKLAEAVQAYRSFVHDHRTDPEVPYARFRVCKALFEQMSEGGFLLPPLEERDQATSVEAYKELTSFVKDYPTGPYAAEGKYMLTVVTGRLVRHELYVGRYYLRNDKFEAAVARIQYGLRTYGDSGLEPEALVLLGETYLKMHRAEEARNTFAQVLSQYPSSAFSTAAKNFLLEMDRERK
jgi:outer membrane protein assembly factor BamD